MIARRLMRVWLDEPVPDRYQTFWRGFARTHPNWDLTTFRSTATLGWMRPEIRAVFDACTTHAGRSDVVRYEALWAFGGVYVDCDVECLRSFEPLIDDDRPFAGWEDGRMVCPTVMGAPRAAPAVGALTAALPEWFAARRDAPPNQSTGPHLLTAVWSGRQDVRLYPPDAFYPVHWSRKRDLGGPYPESSYAVHHWDARWLPGGPPQR